MSNPEDKTNIRVHPPVEEGDDPATRLRSKPEQEQEHEHEHEPTELVQRTDSPLDIPQSTVEVDVGTELCGRFVLEKLLGRGGMSVVYRAKDLDKVLARDPDPYVAVKILTPEFSRHPDAWMALQRETKKCSALSHPRIVTVHDFRLDQKLGLYFAFMEELRGQSLSEVTKAARVHPISKARSAVIVTGIAEGLAYAHEQGIVHSDIKPSNIFLTADDEVKILDFGIARAVPGTDNDEFDVGSLGALTPSYASCEMFEHKEPHPSDDVYALGLIAYELLAGTHPYKAVLAEGEPAIAARDQGIVAKRLKDIKRSQRLAIERAIALRRSERPEDAAAFLKFFRGRPMLPVYLGSAVVVLLLILSWAIWLRPGVPEPDIPFDELPAAQQEKVQNYLGEAQMSFKMGDYNGALYYYDKAFSEHPYNPVTMAGLDDIVELVLEEEPGSSADEIQQELEQLDVLLSYQPLAERGSLIRYRDKLKARLAKL